MCVVAACGANADAVPVGAGWSSKYGAHAVVWQREKPLPQDVDHINVWAPDIAVVGAAVKR